VSPTVGGSRKCGIGALLLLAAIASSVLAQSAPARTRAPGCHARSGLGSLFENRAPAALPGSADPTITGSFAVLRRAIAPSDQPPPLNPLAEDVDYQLAGYYANQVRQLKQLPDGSRFFVIAGLPRLNAIPPARCLPPQLRPKRKQLVEEQLRRAREPVYCIAQIGGGAEQAFGGEVECPRFADIYTGMNLIGSDMSSRPVLELAPDGVVTVRLTYRGGVTVSAAVSENAYLFTPPQAPIRHAEAAFERLARHFFSRSRSKKAVSKRERKKQVQAIINLLMRQSLRLAPQQIEWLAADGHVLRTMTPVDIRDTVRRGR
jgi:hypothetical protein